MNELMKKANTPIFHTEMLNCFVGKINKNNSRMFSQFHYCYCYYYFLFLINLNYNLVNCNINCGCVELLLFYVAVNKLLVDIMAQKDI